MADFSKMTRQQRMKYRRNKLKLSPSYIAQCINVSRVTYTNWEDGRVDEISWPKFMKLAETLLTTPQWLEYGHATEQYIFNDHDGNISRTLQGQHIIKNTSIPVFTLEDKNIDVLQQTAEYVDMPAKAGIVFAIKLLANNSLCRAHIGDAIIVDAQADLINGEEIYLTFKEAPPQICVFNTKREGQLHCLTEDGKIIFSLDEVDQVYPVIAIARNNSIKKRGK
jgi:DNA-binding XRE family transcriptional regulator